MLAPQEFLATSQLTYHGLSELHSALEAGQLAVFFRNNHFCASTHPTRAHHMHGNGHTHVHVHGSTQAWVCMCTSCEHTTCDVVYRHVSVNCATSLASKTIDRSLLSFGSEVAWGCMDDIGSTVLTIGGVEGLHVQAPQVPVSGETLIRSAASRSLGSGIAPGRLPP